MVVSVLNQTKGCMLVARCVVAAHPLARVRGLLHRRSLAEDEGLLLTPCNNIHTWFMRFPIDVVFLGAGGEVLRVVHMLPPFRVRACWRRARAVLELPAGRLARTGTDVGDRLVIMRNG
ncbi:MAG: DUF192 domain-containing protein [Abditibacteriales bacterium]|nr:DUF192 domain-containing protein [Abditibacteriales bacterium]